MQPKPPILVLCDVDDTLLDAHARSRGAAGFRALERIGQARIPVVLSSTKTRAELEIVQQDLSLVHPFLCESGAAVFIPRGYFEFEVPHARDVSEYQVVELARPYDEVVTALHRAADRLGVEVIGFRDMSIADVAHECDLSLTEARLAKLREYTEPFRVVEERSDVMLRLLDAVRTAGFGCANRGRFSYAGAVRRDIGVQYLCGLYRRAFGSLLIAALGDNESAVVLLRDADIPLIIQHDALDAAALLRAAPSARITAVNSVAGWADAILDIAETTQQRGGARSH